MVTELLAGAGAFVVLILAVAAVEFFEHLGAMMTAIGKALEFITWAVPFGALAAGAVVGGWVLALVVKWG
jgi:hypothetical protein